ncbi:MAG: hypothetical protein EOM73_14130, partial [Bacteroidia bacterium]|nr:hypothetical protein [Bacteroidia bacterium]
KKITLEVQQHLGSNMVRTISMSSTDGLKRGDQVINTGHGISVPVGKETLGRILNVLGEAVDGKEQLTTAKRYEIHRPAPDFVDQSTKTEILSAKKFVLDAGALQMLDLDYLPNNCILTPHRLEMELLEKKAETKKSRQQLETVVLIKKGRVDEVWQNNHCQTKISGGNAGLTKGGSGDALAGLIAGLFCYNEPLIAAEYGSKVLKQAGDDLFKNRGPFFTTTQLVKQIPETLWRIIQAERKSA